MGFAEDFGSFVTRSHATNQVKLSSESLEIDSL